MSAKLSNILIRMPNWLGDAIMAYPAIAALHSNGIKVTLYGKVWLRDLYEILLPEVPCRSLGSNFWQARNELLQHPEKRLILLTNSFSSAWQAYLANKHTIGFAGDWRSYLLHCAIKKPQNIHEVAVFWHLVNKAMAFYKLPLLPNLIENSNLHRILDSNFSYLLPEKYIVMCPFAIGLGRNGLPKLWPDWSRLIKFFSKYIPIVICPGPGEVWEENADCANLHVIKNTNIKQLALILSNAHLVIANDSGQMHLASLVNNNVLGLFGVTDPIRTRPWGCSYLGSKDAWPTLTEVIDKVSSMCGIPIISNANIDN